jgi:hypothetical protein
MHRTLRLVLSFRRGIWILGLHCILTNEEILHSVLIVDMI